jgi:hypothetical protein
MYAGRAVDKAFKRLWRDKNPQTSALLKKIAIAAMYNVAFRLRPPRRPFRPQDRSPALDP